MARANFVKAARKAVPSAGINVGDSYYWWKFRNGGKRYSKTHPKPSQLTQSEFLSSVYEIQERVADLPADDTLPSMIEDIINDLNQLADDCRDKHGNMPDSLQYSPTGELLEERADAMESAAGEFEELDTDEPDDETLLEDWDESERLEDETDDTYEKRKETELEKCRAEHWQNLLDEAQGIDIEAP